MQIRRLVMCAYACVWFFDGLMFLFAPQIVGWFSLSDEAAQSAIVVLRAFYFAAILIWPLSFTMPHPLRASGDVKLTMTVSIISMWTCRIAVSYVLVFYCNMGLLGVWMGMFIDWYARGICYLIRYLSGKRIGHKVI